MRDCVQHMQHSPNKNINTQKYNKNNNCHYAFETIPEIQASAHTQIHQSTSALHCLPGTTKAEMITNP